VPAFEVARKIRDKTGVKNSFTLTGAFDYSSEKMNLTGNFWLKKDSALIIKIFGPFGLGNREFTIHDLGIEFLNFLFGFEDTVSGFLVVRGNTYFSPDGSYSFILDKNGLILSVSADEYKIYMMNYKDHGVLKIPHRIRVLTNEGTVNIRIKQVGLPS